MLKPVQFGQSTLVIQGSAYKPIADMAIQFNQPANGPHVTVSPATLEGDQVKITVKGPAVGEVTGDKSDFNYDPERQVVSALTTMLKIAGVPMPKVTLESEDRPDLSNTFISEFRDQI